MPPKNEHDRFHDPGACRDSGTGCPADRRRGTCTRVAPRSFHGLDRRRDIGRLGVRRTPTTFVLDEEMRRRLATLNPQAAAQLGARLVEATDRGFWEPDAATLDALRDASVELEDWLEGVHVTP